MVDDRPPQSIEQEEVMACTGPKPLSSAFPDLVFDKEGQFYTLPGRPKEGEPVDFTSEATLRQHGLILQPPCANAPENFVRVWEKITSRPWRVASGAIKTGRRTDRKTTRMVSRRSSRVSEGGSAGGIDSPNWCGSFYSYPNPGALTLSTAWINFVAPSLTFPPLNLNLPASPGGGYILSIWVGLDGGQVNQVNPPDLWQPGGDILQAGVEFSVGIGSPWTLWYEWLSPTVSGQTLLSGLPIDFFITPNDDIFIQVSYSILSGTNEVAGASFIFANYTTGVAIPSISIDLPPCTYPNGSTVEWIVETTQITSPADAKTGNIIQNFSTLPAFDQINVNYGGASGPGGKNSSASWGTTPINLVAPYPVPNNNLNATLGPEGTPGVPELVVSYVS